MAPFLSQVGRALAVLLMLTMSACSAQETGARTEGAAQGGFGSCPPVSLERNGSQERAIEADNNRGTWDLRGAVWEGSASSPIEYPVRSDAWTKGCIFGGRINGGIPRRWTRDQWYDGQDGGVGMNGDAFRQTMTDTPGNFVVIRGAHVKDFEDAYDPNSRRASSTTYLLRVQARFIRDDCVENEDVPHNLVVRNSLFDGCFTAFAERPSGSSSARNGKGDHSFTVESSLIHVRPQRLGPNYCGDDEVREGRCRPTRRAKVWLGAYGIWKWSRKAASEVTVRDTIFRLDMPSYSSCSSQEWPAGNYEDVTVVWTGRGPYRAAGGCHNVLPKGVELTRDLGVWRQARKAWLER